MSRHLTSVLAVVVIILSATATPVLAAGKPAQPPGQIRGIVMARNKAGKIGISGGNLLYNGGPVMHTNKTYAIYWVPSGYSISSRYESLINGFFTNVAAASGRTSNVYYSTTQYYDTVHGNILYKSTFGGAALDTRTFPVSGCSDPYTKVCLTDGQLQTEINRVATAHGWSRSGTIFFMFTAKGVGSCAYGYCAFSDYCAYHSDFLTSAGDTLYANMPYAETVPAACDSGQHPNGDAAADAEINLISHEHAETITDMLGTAWYDLYGNENGDKCAWDFKTVLGTTSYGEYNQLIGTGKYYMQSEWSNNSSGCVLTGT